MQKLNSTNTNPNQSNPDQEMSVEQLIQAVQTENSFNPQLFQSLTIEDENDMNRLTSVALQCVSDDLFIDMVDRGWIELDMFLMDDILQFQRLDLLKRVLAHKKCGVSVSIDNLRDAAMQGNLKALETMLPFYKYKRGDYIDSDWCGIEKDYQTNTNIHVCIDFLLNHANQIKWYNSRRFVRSE